MKPKLKTETDSPQANQAKPKSAGSKGNKRSIDETAEDGGKANGDKRRKVSGDGTKKTAKRNPTDSQVSARPSAKFLDARQRKLLDERKRLPIWIHRADIRFALRLRGDVLVLVGETGSGKSTQVPQFLLSEPWLKRQHVTFRDDNGEEKEGNVGGMVAVTEPRRVAAVSLAQRVAAETGSHLGPGMNSDDRVGYSVRFESSVPKNAKIKYLTEGMLLQELLRDQNLRKYSCIIVDEVHERSVDVDLLLGFLKNIVSGDLSGRGGIPLKIIIMSATADVAKLKEFFALPEPPTPVQPGAGNEAVEGEQHPDTAPRRSSVASNHSLHSASSSWSGLSEKSDPAPTSPSASTKTNDQSQEDKAVSTKATQDEFEDDKAATAVASDNLQKLEGTKNTMVHYIAGRQHPVSLLYTPEPVADILEACFRTIFIVHSTEPMPGDILVFLTGQEDIGALQARVEEQAEHLLKQFPRIEVVPLFGQMSIEKQQVAFARAKNKNARKVILATNIAETSVTVPGVRYVIDTGKAKVKEYRPHLGLASLLAKPISKSSATQRKGRAGREAPGKVWRLYSEKQFLELPDADRPEILRSDVVEAVLKMKARGIEDIFSFPLMDAPPRDTLIKALNHLFNIGALGADGALNDVGKRMATFPLTPNYARVLVAAAEVDSECVLEAIDAIAVLSGDDIFKQPQNEEEREASEEARKDLVRREGDVLTQLTAMQRYCAEAGQRRRWCERHLVHERHMETAASVRRQLRLACVQAGMLAKADLEAAAAAAAGGREFVPLGPERAETLLRCFLRAFVGKTALLDKDGVYKTTVGRHAVVVHPSSVMHGKKKEAIMYLEHVYTNKNYAKKCSGVQMDWIMEVMGSAG